MGDVESQYLAGHETLSEPPNLSGLNDSKDLDSGVSSSPTARSVNTGDDGETQDGIAEVWNNVDSVKAVPPNEVQHKNLGSATEIHEEPGEDEKPPHEHVAHLPVDLQVQGCEYLHLYPCQYDSIHRPHVVDISRRIYR